MLARRHLEQHRRLRGLRAAPPQPHGAGIARGGDVAAVGAARAAGVSSSIQLAQPLASGRTKPSGTNDLVPRSNSRSTTASLPPRDSRTIARSCLSGRVPAPPQIQSSPSAVASASRSSSTSHCGSSLAEALGRGAPPQAARMRRVGPEVVEPGPAPAGERDLVGPVEDRGQRRGVLLDRAGRRRPPACGRSGRSTQADGARALDLLQPELRIVVRRGERWPDVDRHALLRGFADEGDLAEAGLGGVGQRLGDVAVGHALVGAQVDLGLRPLLALLRELRRRRPRG